MTEANTPEEKTNPITPDHVENAEALLGIEFTPAERQQMLETLANRLGQYEAIRNTPLDNSIPMALQFSVAVDDPQPADVPRAYPMSAQPPVTRPDNLEDVAFYTVTQLAELIRTQQVTSVELTEMYLDRLHRYNEVLQCVVSFTDDLAMEQARRADAEIAQGYYRGPLHGIPWGAKDLLATKGYKTTWGAMPYRDQSIDMDATVVQRLEAAGAVLIAKLTMGALAYGDIWFGGTTKNPWDINEGSSGSSAGPGSATAAGLVGFSIGTETMGSIVSPSTRCGISGLRPTFGRVSRNGAMALCWSMDKIGPMCRSVEDCALVFSAIYGPDGQDLTITPQPFNWNPALDPHSLRIGYIPQAFEMPAEPVTQRPDGTEIDIEDTRHYYATNAAVLDVMRDQGFDLVPIELPNTDMNALYVILLAEAAAAFDEITRNHSDDTMQWQEDNAWPNSFRAARFIPAVEYINANRIRTQLMRDMAQVMQSIDVFIVPSFEANALQITNYTGHPTVVVPDGFTRRNTPQSISFIGGLYKEAETLAVAKAYQDATDWHKRYPTVPLT
ncbi:MAG: amidase [Anaerolineaceae bacterium]|nr:amidase [Anaerolineaceae bacterium]